MGSRLLRCVTDTAPTETNASPEQQRVGPFVDRTGYLEAGIGRTIKIVTVQPLGRLFANSEVLEDEFETFA